MPHTGDQKRRTAARTWKSRTALGREERPPASRPTTAAQMTVTLPRGDMHRPRVPGLQGQHSHDQHDQKGKCRKGTQSRIERHGENGRADPDCRSGTRFRDHGGRSEIRPACGTHAARPSCGPSVREVAVAVIDTRDTSYDARGRRSRRSDARVTPPEAGPQAHLCPCAASWPIDPTDDGAGPRAEVSAMRLLDLRELRPLPAAAAAAAEVSRAPWLRSGRRPALWSVSS